MTFNEFIKAITPEQVSTWWETIAPTEAPEKVEEENWKYKLCKNGKTLPFKYTVTELALQYNLDFKSKDFSSNAANRDAFCDAFDFEVIEDLVYDNTEAQSFVAFHNSLKQTSATFQEASNYLHSIISTNEINPYKIRMALRDAKKQAMVIIGMRAVFAFREENGKARIAMILDKAIYESNKSLLNVTFEEKFNGKPENKVLISFDISDWNEIPLVIIENNTKEFLLQYNSIKDTKRATWNTEANTTNSVFKYLLFKDEDIEEWVINTTNLKMNNFKELISSLERYLNEGDSKIKNFKIVPNRLSTKYVWFYDNDKVLGDMAAHYEIELRKGKLSIDIHFEDKNKNLFEQEILKLALPDKIKLLERFPRYKRKEITYYEMYDFNTPDVIPKLANALLYLEETIGDSIRAIKANIKNIIPTSTAASNQDMKHPLNQILYGPPGTGKTYTTKELAVSIINAKFIDDLDTNLSEVERRKAISDEYKRLFELGQIVFTTFHQSMSYEDFVEGIKPETINDDISYSVQKGIFKELCIKAEEKQIKSNNFDEAYQLLLKEIDTFGASGLVLETLIQSKEFTIYKNSKNNIRFHANTEKAYDGVIKREYLEHYLKTGEAVDWPSYVKALGNYVREKFDYKQSEEVVNKPYVLIIDEINRGNVSAIFGELITLLEEDKRIGNKEELRIKLPYSKKEADFGVPSNLYIIGTMNTADRSVEALDTALRRRFSFTEVLPDSSLLEAKSVNGINLKKLLDTINNRIEILLNRDHTIGHSYFIKLDNDDVKGLRSTFKNNIIPLLQEYFYGDYEKIGMVLGAGFVSLSDQNLVSFPKFIKNNDYNTSRYELISIDENFDIINALGQLWE
jgi:5-methylcytosine-specific restriction protein B